MNIHFGHGNPYQNLLYSAPHMPYRCARGRQYRFAGLADKVDRGGPRLLHLHWDDRMFRRVEQGDDGVALDDRAFDDLERFRARGGRILWTVHNARPHKDSAPEVFRAGRVRLCRLVDLIHVHTPHARDHLVAEYRAPAQRIRVVPHPSYLGAYEAEETTLARPLPAAPVRAFLFFGMLRMSKGLRDVERSVRRLERRGAEYTLAVHGKGFRLQKRILDRISVHDHVTTSGGRIPDEEVAALFSRSQVYLAPYHDVFTSGAIMLAQTFGLPVIGPDTPGMRQTVPEACHALLYPTDHPRGLLRRMLDVIAMDDAELADYRRATLEFAVERAPNRISEQISELLDELTKTSITPVV